MPVSTKPASVRNQLFTRSLCDQVSCISSIFPGSKRLLSFTLPPPDPPLAGHSRSAPLRHNHALETFEIICNRLRQCKESLKKFLGVAERHAQRARLQSDSRRQRVDAGIQHSRLHGDLPRAATAFRPHPFNGLFKTQSAPAFLMKAIAIQQHLKLRDQPFAVHQKRMASLIAPSPHASTESPAVAGS